MLGAKDCRASRQGTRRNGVDQNSYCVTLTRKPRANRPTHSAQRSAALALFRRTLRPAPVQTQQGVPGVLQAFAVAGRGSIALCCFTNKDRRVCGPLLQEAGLGGYFAFTLCADRSEDRKPSPNMLLAACSRLGIAPPRCCTSVIPASILPRPGLPVVRSFAVKLRIWQGPFKHRRKSGWIRGQADRPRVAVPAVLRLANSRLKLCTTGKPLPDERRSQ